MFFFCFLDLDDSDNEIKLNQFCHNQTLEGIDFVSNSSSAKSTIIVLNHDASIGINSFQMDRLICLKSSNGNYLKLLFNANFEYEFGIGNCFNQLFEFSSISTRWTSLPLMRFPINAQQINKEFSCSPNYCINICTIIIVVDQSLIMHSQQINRLIDAIWFEVDTFNDHLRNASNKSDCARLQIKSIVIHNSKLNKRLRLSTVNQLFEFYQLIDQIPKTYCFGLYLTFDANQLESNQNQLEFCTPNQNNMIFKWFYAQFDYVLPRRLNLMYSILKEIFKSRNHSTSDCVVVESQSHSIMKRSTNEKKNCFLEMFVDTDKWIQNDCSNQFIQNRSTTELFEDFTFQELTGSIFNHSITATTFFNSTSTDFIFTSSTLNYDETETEFNSSTIKVNLSAKFPEVIMSTALASKNPAEATLNWFKFTKESNTNQSVDIFDKRNPTHNVETYFSIFSPSSILADNFFVDKTEFKKWLVDNQLTESSTNELSTIISSKSTTVPTESTRVATELSTKQLLTSFLEDTSTVSIAEFSTNKLSRGSSEESTSVSTTELSTPFLEDFTTVSTESTRFVPNSTTKKLITSFLEDSTTVSTTEIPTKKSSTSLSAKSFSITESAIKNLLTLFTNESTTLSYESTNVIPDFSTKHLKSKLEDSTTLSYESTNIIPDFSTKHLKSKLEDSTTRSYESTSATESHNPINILNFPYSNLKSSVEYVDYKNFVQIRDFSIFKQNFQVTDEHTSSTTPTVVNIPTSTEKINSIVETENNFSDHSISELLNISLTIDESPFVHTEPSNRESTDNYSVEEHRGKEIKPTSKQTNIKTTYHSNDNSILQSTAGSEVFQKSTAKSLITEQKFQSTDNTVETVPQTSTAEDLIENINNLHQQQISIVSKQTIIQPYQLYLKRTTLAHVINSANKINNHIGTGRTIVDKQHILSDDKVINQK